MEELAARAVPEGTRGLMSVAVAPYGVNHLLEPIDIAIGFAFRSQKHKRKVVNVLPCHISYLFGCNFLRLRNDAEEQLPISGFDLVGIEGLRLPKVFLRRIVVGRDSPFFRALQF